MLEHQSEENDYHYHTGAPSFPVKEQTEIKNEGLTVDKAAELFYRPVHHDILCL